MSSSHATSVSGLANSHDQKSSHQHRRVKSYQHASSSYATTNGDYSHENSPGKLKFQHTMAPQQPKKTSTSRHAEHSANLSKNGHEDGHELTFCIIGCGTMGIAILSGILATIDEMHDSSATTSNDDQKIRLPSRFIASVEFDWEVENLQKVFAKFSTPVEIITKKDNLQAFKEADVFLLSCKPWGVEGILSAEGVPEALDGKILVSICAGVSAEQMEGYLKAGRTTPATADGEQCRVVRAMPNTSALIRESMTVISLPDVPLRKDQEELVTWIFSKIGKVSLLPSKNMDAVTALCGSGPAFCLLVLEALADGGVAMGIPRAEAQKMAAQVMRGASSMVLDGNHPAVLRDNVCTPGGCTIGGLMTMEERGVRGAVSRAVREATVVASQLGQGVQNVNGTRF